MGHSLDPLPALVLLNKNKIRTTFAGTRFSSWEQVLLLLLLLLLLLKKLVEYCVRWYGVEALPSYWTLPSSAVASGCPWLQGHLEEVEVTCVLRPLTLVVLLSCLRLPLHPHHHLRRHRQTFLPLDVARFRLVCGWEEEDVLLEAASCAPVSLLRLAFRRCTMYTTHTHNGKWR